MNKPSRTPWRKITFLKPVKSQIKMKLAVQQFVEKEFSGKVDVSEGEAKAFYDENPQYFTQPEAIRASGILIKVDPKSDAAKKEEARKKLEDIQKRAQKGEDLAVLAKDFSQDASAAQGGDLGTIPRGRMPKALDDAAFSLKPGEVSNGGDRAGIPPDQGSREKA
jgi:peptidyl-prolyl cis-trans isomerase C